MMRRSACAAGVAVFLAMMGRPREGAAIDRNFAGSAQLDYHLVPTQPGARAGATAFDGFTSEVALKVAVDVSERLSANVKLCHGCHGFELPMAYFDYRVADELNFRVGRFSPSFGSFNLRHDPANHPLSSKPLPYDMGRMLRYADWNLGVLPSPFPDNGLEIGGSHWFGERAQMDYAVYAVAGFKAAAGALDLDWTQSHSGSSYLVDNNSRPTVGARAALTLRIRDTNDVTVGASAMRGTYDPRNQFDYLIVGGDVAIRIWRTHVRLEYLVRRQTFEATPAVMFKEPVSASGMEIFNKHGAYLELQHPVTANLDLVGRIDGLYRAGNVPVDSPLGVRSAITRYTAGAALAIERGWWLKTSAELWSFSDHVFGHEALDLGIHLSIAGTC